MLYESQTGMQLYIMSIQHNLIPCHTSQVLVYHQAKLGTLEETIIIVRLAN